jgi:hypothetical protein
MPCDLLVRIAAGFGRTRGSAIGTRGRVASASPARSTSGGSSEESGTAAIANNITIP